jgi:hypothetical protein
MAETTRNSRIGEVLTTKFTRHCKKLTEYGTVLDTINLQPVEFPYLKLSHGDLLLIPGLVVHGGPAFTGFRAILFLLVTPREKMENFTILISNIWPVPY